MAFHSELFRRGGQQQESFRFAAEFLDNLVLATGRSFGPFKMMRLIHDEHIPTCRYRLRGAARIRAKEINTGQDELIIQKWIRARLTGFDGGATFFIKNIQPDVEAPQHFHEPLMHERFGHQHQNAIGPSTQQQTMQDQTGLDGFSQADFIREHHARGMPVGDLLRDVKLVRNQIDATADKSAHRRFARAVKQIQGAATKFKRR